MIPLILSSLMSAAYAVSFSAFGTTINNATINATELPTENAAAMGLLDLNVNKHEMPWTDWDQFADLVEAQVGNVNGTIVFVEFYSNDQNPTTAFTKTNVKGIELVFRQLGQYYHRYYALNTAGTAYVIDSAYSFEMQGSIPCTTTTVMQARTFGTMPQRSTMYQFVWAGTDELVESDELGDPTHQVMDVAYNQSATYSFFDSAIRDVNPGEGVGPGDGNPEDHCRRVQGQCANATQAGPVCDMLSASCRYPGESPPAGSGCTAYSMATAGLYSSNYSLLYTFRDRLFAYNLHSYVVTYALYSWYVVTTQQHANAMPEIETAANVVVNGTSSQVVLTSSLKTKIEGLITLGQGKNSYLDAGLATIQTKLNATVGMTRSQFCTYMVNDSDCTP